MKPEYVLQTPEVDLIDSSGRGYLVDVNEEAGLYIVEPIRKISGLGAFFAGMQTKIETPRGSADNHCEPITTVVLPKGTIVRLDDKELDKAEPPEITAPAVAFRGRNVSE